MLKRKHFSKKPKRPVSSFLSLDSFSRSPSRVFYKLESEWIWKVVEEEREKGGERTYPKEMKVKDPVKGASTNMLAECFNTRWLMYRYLGTVDHEITERTLPSSLVDICLLPPPSTSLTIRVKERKRSFYVDILKQETFPSHSFPFLSFFRRFLFSYTHCLFPLPSSRFSSWNNVRSVTK